MYALPIEKVSDIRPYFTRDELDTALRKALERIEELEYEIAPLRDAGEKLAFKFGDESVDVEGLTFECPECGEEISLD